LELVCIYGWQEHFFGAGAGAGAGADGQSVKLVVDGLQEGHVHELHAEGVRSAAGLPLLHPEAYYTLNYFVE